jgi:adenylyltransferase/sulfurtransferase
LTSLDIPFPALADDLEEAMARISREKPVFVVCRFGNDSQLAVNAMKSLEKKFVEVKDLKGGLNAWAEAFPTDIIPKY